MPRATQLLLQDFENMEMVYAQQASTSAAASSLSPSIAMSTITGKLPCAVQSAVVALAAHYSSDDVETMFAA